MLTPRTITYDQSLPAKNLPFPPCGRRVSPIQAASCHLQSGHGECLPATQLYLSVFTCPTVSLDLPSDYHRTPARASRPDNLTFSTPRPARLTHPDREYFPPVGCRREPPGHTSYIVMSLPVQRSESWSPVGRRRGAPGQTILLSSVFTCPTQRVLISGWTPARCSRPDNLTFFCLYLSNAASLNLRLDTGEVLPARQSYFLCLYLSNTASPGISLDAGEVLPARQPYFSCPTKQVLVSRWTPARCSRPDNLTFPVFTCPTKQVLVSRWTPARCSRPDKRSSVCSHQKISNPVERDIPGRFGKLSLQSTTGEAPPPSSQVSISPQMPQEPPGWTTSPFPPASAKLTHQPMVGTPTSWMSAKHPDQKLYLSVFTCPTQWVLISHRTPARCSRPDNLAFSSPTLATLTRPTQRVLCPRWASARASQRDDLPASHLADETNPLDSVSIGLTVERRRQSQSPIYFFRPTGDEA